MRLLNAFAGFCLFMAAAMTSPVSAQCPPDTEDPVITDTPANISASAEAGLCGATIDWTVPTASDNCEVTFFGANQVPGDFYAVGITTVTYTAMDAEGNMAASSFTISISDDEDPTISDLPADISVNNDTGNCSAVVTWDAPTGNDNCGIASLTSDHDSGDTFPVGTTTVTYTATDVNGNSITDSFDITVSDNEAPSVATNDVTLVLDASGAASTTATAVNNGSSDNCSIASIDLSQTDFDCTHVGTNTVTLTVTDIHSNQGTATATITVQDNQAPVIAQMADISATNDANNCSAVVTWTDPAVTDNCTYTLTSDIASGTAFDVGVTTVTYSVTDAGGNTDSMSFDVTVTDTQGPTISGTPGDITQAKDAGSCDAVVTWTAPTATDNCTLATLGSDINSGTTFDLGPTTVTYTAIDIYGNTTTESFTVTITDSDYDGDLDGDCTDPDIDGDGALNAADSDDFNENVCSDTDMDGCDDCSSGSYDPANDGTDFDGDGLCDLGDPDDDNDGALDGADSDDNDANVCSDTDSDGCD
ncbi:MAG: HYR domain-containing protein, partial [Flavobacteriales bacterium]